MVDGGRQKTKDRRQKTKDRRHGRKNGSWFMVDG
jgi:hypothetical protein